VCESTVQVSGVTGGAVSVFARCFRELPPGCAAEAEGFGVVRAEADGEAVRVFTRCF